MPIPVLTANSPSAGYFSWTAFNIQYWGKSFAIPAGNSNKRYVFWRYNNGAGGPLQGSDALPNDLTEDDLLLFMNKSGIPINVLASQVIDGDLIADGTIMARAVGANQIHGDHISADAITAKHRITGALIQSEEAMDRGIKFDSSALVSWDASGNPKFILNAATGDLIVNGGTFQTTDAANRGVKLGPTGLKAYDGSGNQTVAINSDGTASFKGSVTVTGGSVPASTVSGTLTADNIPSLAPSKLSSGALPSGVLLPGPQLISGGTGHKVFHDVLAFNHSADNLSGRLRIATPITFGAYMVNLAIKGFNYTYSTADIDCSVQFHAYNTTSFFANAYSFVSRGSAEITQVELASDSSNRVVIYLTIKGGVWRYPKVAITEVAIGHSTPPDTFRSGWSASIVSSTTTGDTIRQTVTQSGTNGHNVMDSHALTQTWRASGKTTIDGGHIEADTIRAGAIAADAIGAKHVLIGPTIKTASSGRRVELTSAEGISAYDANDNKTFYMDSATGRLNLLGNIEQTNTHGKVIVGPEVAPNLNPAIQWRDNYQAPGYVSFWPSIYYNPDPFKSGELPAPGSAATVGALTVSGKFYSDWNYPLGEEDDWPHLSLYDTRYWFLGNKSAKIKGWADSGEVQIQTAPEGTSADDTSGPHLEIQAKQLNADGTVKQNALYELGGMTTRIRGYEDVGHVVLETQAADGSWTSGPRLSLDANVDGEAAESWIGLGWLDANGTWGTSSNQLLLFQDGRWRLGNTTDATMPSIGANYITNFGRIDINAPKGVYVNHDLTLNGNLIAGGTTRFTGTLGVIDLHSGTNGRLVVGTDSASFGILNSATHACLRMYSSGDWMLGQETESGTHGKLYFTHSSNFIHAIGGGFRVMGYLDYYNPPTSTFGANVGISSTPKDRFYKLTSARRYKVNIETFDEGKAERLLDLDPRIWFDRRQVEDRVGKEKVTETAAGPQLAESELPALLVERTVADADGGEYIEPGLRRIPGLVAEEVEAVGLEEYVTYTVDQETGERLTDSLMYDRLWTLLIPIVRKQREQIAALETRITTLEGNQ